jgi:hypothetical protein
VRGASSGLTFLRAPLVRPRVVPRFNAGKRDLPSSRDVRTDAMEGRKHESEDRRGNLGGLRSIRTSPYGRIEDARVIALGAAALLNLVMASPVSAAQPARGCPDNAFMKMTYFEFPR